MTDPVELAEARVETRSPALPIVQRAVVLAGALSYLDGHPLLEAIRSLVGGLTGTTGYDLGRWWSFSSDAFWIVTYVGTLLVAGSLALRLARLAARRRPASEAVAVRADGAGLQVGGALLLPRQQIESARVTSDPDVGFIVVVHAHDGSSARVRVRSEAEAGELAIALDPSSVPGQIVFEGASSSRTRETVAALGAIAGVALTSGLRDPVGEVAWHLGRDLLPEFWSHPGSWEFWAVFGVSALGVWAALALAALAARPAVKRLLPGQTAVDAVGVLLGEGKRARRIAAADIERVETSDAPEVVLGLRSGDQVRIAFAADRPVAERDAFASRVRAAMAGEPAAEGAETSGVRVEVAEEAAEEPTEERETEERRAAQV